MKEETKQKKENSKGTHNKGGTKWEWAFVWRGRKTYTCKYHKK